MKHLTSKLPKCGLKVSGIPFILYSPAYALISGSVKAGIMLSQAVYWQSMNPEFGWWFQTQKKWQIETGLSKREQETARTLLRKLPFWEEKIASIPAKLFYRVNLELLAEHLQCSLVKREGGSGNQAKSPYSKYYNDPRWKSFSARIRERDNHTCTTCGITSNVATLQAHHLYYVARRKPWEYQDSALVTLCADCHAARHQNPVEVEEWEKQVGGIQ